MKTRARGQSLVEFALMLPILVFFIMGIIDLGYYVFTYSELENVTRRASEFASKAAPTNSNCLTIAKEDAVRNIVLSDKAQIKSNLGIAIRSGKREVGQPIEANLTYTGTFITPLARGILGKNFTFNFTSQRTILSTAPVLKPDNITTINCG